MSTRNPLCVAILMLAAVVPSVSQARLDKPDEGLTKGGGGPQRILVLDGSNVHNVGELQMHIGNWGAFGSYPGSANPFAEQPSAQWPAGSGVEYLYVAGLWIGALKAGVPAVTTSAYAAEFRPDQSDPLQIVYRTSEGARGGSRAPAPTADDDSDGIADEDWLNGRDDDFDGRVDEDFAAVSKQMFACEYTDYGTASIQIYPNHNPLNLHVRQESYQWEEDRFDDFIGAVFYITNNGNDVLEDMYIGFFADGDAGSRDVDNYFEDDGAALYRNPVVCTDLGPVSLDVAFCYDIDGDEGQTDGYFGIMFLDHPIDPTGENGPRRVGITTYANFSGSASYEDGGDPTNDFERYELMSSHQIDGPGSVARDYRVMVSAGPFASIAPGQTVKFSIALVVAERDDFTNVQRAAQAYHGLWFDLDGNPSTGIDGKEHQENWYLPENPVPVAITSFDARATSSGVALAWQLWSDEAIEGIDILRAARDGEMTPLVSSLAATTHGYVDRTAVSGSTYEYQLVVHSRESGVILSQRAGATVPGAALAFHPATPNPFTSDATLSFSLAERGPVELAVYDVSGRRVATVFSGERNAGEHAFHWNGIGDDGNRASAGIYFCRLRAGKETLTRKISLVR